MNPAHNIHTISKRRELFVDESMIDGFAGAARLKLHQPRREEVVLEHDEPWEGNISGYATILREINGEYRMYASSPKCVQLIAA